MVFFNWATMQMAAKIVYYGPGLCGKTSNLSFIYAKTSPKSRGEMVSLETESDRTLFFDLLPIEVGTIGGFKTRLQLYTVPGQVFYNTTRKLVLKGVDGLVFVADSQRPMREANIESFHSLTENLRELGLEMEDLPLVLQYNKRDLKNVLTEEELNSDLNPDDQYTSFLASAITGEGIFETLKEITKVTLKKLRKRMAAPAPEAPSRPKSKPTVAAPAPSPTPSSSPVQPSTPSPSIPVPPTRVPTAAPTTISAASLALAAEEGVGDEEPIAAPVPPPPTLAPNDQSLAANPPATAAAVEEPAEQAQTPEPVASPEPPDAPVAETEQAPEEEPASSPEESQVGAEAVKPPEETEPTEPEEVVQPPVAEIPDEDPFDQPEAAIDEAEVEFDTSSGADKKVEPPPLKRVQVPNQMDILSELDGLRRNATESSSTRRRRSPTVPDLDLDALLTGGNSKTQDVKKRVEKSLNSNIFQEMQSVQLALRIQDSHGDTIHTMEPVSMHVGNAESLEKLILQLTVNLENVR